MNRIATTVATAGIACSAASPSHPPLPRRPCQDGPSYVIDGPGNGNGPDAFIVTDHGRVPVFFCDVDKSKAHAKKSLAGRRDASGRF